ncbi:MAG: helix-turn-helix domain-containing protein [Euzebya sp.]
MRDPEDVWKGQLETLGRFIRTQRQNANLSLRQLADLTKVSNPYLSQIERGLHEPSVRVLKSVAEALDLSAETLLHQAGLIADRVAGEEGSGDTGPAGAQRRTEVALRADPLLSPEQAEALIAVYRSYIGARGSQPK